MNREQSSSEIAPDSELSDFSRELGEIVGAQIGIQFQGKEALLHSRLSSRLRVLGLHSIEDYVDFFKNHTEAELPELISLFTTHKTEFFRENEQFSYLYHHVFPKLILTGQPIRIWSAGSSTGEEAYSIAITFLEFMRSVKGWEARLPDFKVIGTDVDSRCIKTATEGVYLIKHTHGLQRPIIERYFDEGKGDLSKWIRVKDEVWRLCEFKVMNLLEQPSKLPAFHVVLARNLFIYFFQDSVRKAMRNVVDHLVNDGLFFVGLMEKLDTSSFPFVAFGKSIYKEAR